MDTEKENEGQTPQKMDTSGPYWQALTAALDELGKLKEEEKKIVYRKAQLHETIKALMPLVGMTTSDVGDLSLSNAIRFVFSSVGVGRHLTAPDIRTKLEEIGYDLKQFPNPLASIHTAIRRMVDTDELNLIEDEEEKKKRFEKGPELKPVPEANSVSLLHRILAAQDEKGQLKDMK